MSTGTRGSSALSPVMTLTMDSLLGHAYTVMPSGGYMSKKYFIALAEHIKTASVPFTAEHLEVLAAFCKSQNGNFNKHRWLGYIKGECGPCGGAVK